MPTYKTTGTVRILDGEPVSSYRNVYRRAHELGHWRDPHGNDHSSKLTVRVSIPRSEVDKPGILVSLHNSRGSCFSVVTMLEYSAMLDLMIAGLPAIQKALAFQEKAYELIKQNLSHQSDAINILYSEYYVKGDPPTESEGTPPLDNSESL